MGLLALVLPSLLLPVRRDLDHGNSDDNGDNSNDDDDDDDDDNHNFHDVLTTNTPHPRVRRVYSNVTRAVTEDDTLDIESPNRSPFARLKEYVWPDDDKASMESFIPNYRWTPIISGILIPFSILLEIPGLTQHWYIRTENDVTVETKPNSIILDVGLGISVACAVIANIALVLRFLEKRVQTVTLICIIFLTLHDLINIAAVTTFGIEHRFSDGFTYGPAFWTTLCSTIVSLVTNVSLIVDLIRTPDFSKRGSGLTRKQRALMIIVILLLVYLALGSLINFALLDLSFIDGLYFAVVSIETIGFGDITPKSTGARVWTCFYIAVGIINIGVAIAMCRETVLEGLEIGYRRRIRDMRQKRREARRFRRWKRLWQRAIEFRLRESGQPVWVANAQPTVIAARKGMHLPFFRKVGRTIKRTATMTSVDHVFGGHRGYHLNLDALSNDQLEAAALETGVPLSMFLDPSERQQSGSNDRSAAHTNETHGGVELANAAQAFKESIASDWPSSNLQTPTHAQVGRMAAMITKFAVTVVGAHAPAPGLPHEAFVARTAEEREQRGTHGSQDQGEAKRHPMARWLNDLPHGNNTRSVWAYEKYKEDVEAEEKKAYFVKLTIALSLFLLFWMIGSAIFSATENWSFGVAFYFCFVAFTTTGYGDYAPRTPAGRSIFVVWALFGVGTLTILVAVIQEAGSSRYKSALHSHVLEKAVVQYRKKSLQESKRPHPEDRTKQATSSTSAKKSHHDRLRERETVAQQALETLPHEIVIMAATFGDLMRFSHNGGKGNSLIEKRDEDTAERGEACAGEGRSASGKLKVPREMRALLDELGQLQDMNGRVRGEILQDEESRKTLILLTLERSLKRLLGSAEKALTALADRDALQSLVATADRVSSERGSAHSSFRRTRSDASITAVTRSRPSSPPATPSPPPRPERIHARGTEAPGEERGAGEADGEVDDHRRIVSDPRKPPAGSPTSPGSSSSDHE
ncbi:uncharacterized protein BXZ73DRAFT_41985 [Epithele typhae]|uniref:uncharacterized protein n=1 Tax=Epithele typhae TaxID=378194 RepID=UPI00200898BF|nr:uncharacterized protein BXZ73DRAFT_41985 [Epithele typhae]KAH9941150.1 hypothetical protein BXZ73DRAFT_41985 [Epithele typhae]